MEHPAGKIACCKVIYTSNCFFALSRCRSRSTRGNRSHNKQACIHEEINTSTPSLFNLGVVHGCMNRGSSLIHTPLYFHHRDRASLPQEGTCMKAGSFLLATTKSNYREPFRCRLLVISPRLPNSRSAHCIHYPLIYFKNSIRDLKVRGLYCLAISCIYHDMSFPAPDLTVSRKLGTPFNLVLHIGYMSFAMLSAGFEWLCECHCSAPIELFQNDHGYSIIFTGSFLYSLTRLI